jgi:pimeloyl-ACP methyl ester carboxylesterase
VICLLKALQCLLVVASAYFPYLASAGVCADGGVADGKTRAGANGICMVIQAAPVSSINSTAPLIVIVHGDNGGKMKGGRYVALATKLSQEFSSPAFFMLRPGYEGDAGKSDGFARYEDDDYTKKNIEFLAAALDQLKNEAAGRKLILVGHSGGAAMSAVLIALYPQLVDAVVLAGCPCNVQPWRQWRKESAGKRDGYWPNSLSPSDFTNKTSSKSVIVAITGDGDTNTLPKFAEEYIKSLRANGVENTAFISAPGSTHGTVPESRELVDGVRYAIEKISNGTKQP